MITNAALGPADVTPQSAPQISTRFVPDSLHWDGAAWKLRGALVLLPPSDETVPIGEWVGRVAKALKGDVCLLIAADPGPTDWDGSGSDAYPARALYDRSSSSIQGPLWETLMTPKPRTGVRADVLAVIERHRGDQPLVDAMSATGTISAGVKFGARPGFTNDALLFSTKSHLSATTLPPIRVNRAGTSVLASAIAQSGGAQLVNSVNGAISAAQTLNDVQIMSQVTPAEPALVDVQLLFMGALQPDPQINAYSGKLKSGQLAASVAARLGARGSKAARKAKDCQHALSKAREAQNPLHRIPPIRGPEIRPTKPILDHLRTIYTSDDQLAEAVVSHGRAPPLQAIALKIVPTEALVRHMMVLCPDPEPPGPRIEYMDANGTKQSMSANAAVGLYRTLRSLNDQRVSGLLSYPSLARALRLIIDVEADLSALPKVVQSGLTGNSRFIVAGAFGTVTKSKLWSRCQLSEGRFTLVGEDEVHSVPEDSSERLAGVYNLNCQYYDGNEYVQRFQATSIDVVAKAEQLITKAKSDAAKTSSGSSDDEGTGTTRTVGISILDAQRAIAVQQEAQRGQSLQRDISQADKPIILQAEDLTAGLCLDVGVVRRGGGGLTWRSLMRRSLRYGPAKTSAGTIDVEDLVSRTIAAAAPVLNGVTQIATFRRRLEECSYRAPTRVVPTKPTPSGENVDDAAAIALEAIGHWEGDPLGAPALQPGSDSTEVDTTEGSAAHEVVLDEMLVMPLAIELDIPSQAPGLTPPRMEIGRKFVFAARDSYLGGLGLPPDDLDTLYGTGVNPCTLPLGTNGFLERHERIGAPMLAEIFPVAPKGASDSQVHMIVRSSDSLPDVRQVARRIFLAPSVHQSFAAMHQHPNVAGRKALDTDIMLGKRAAGGMVNVAMDPDNGGLQVLFRGAVVPRSKVPKPATSKDPTICSDDKPKHETPTDPPAMGVFSVSETAMADLTARKVPYFPDPMVQSFALQLWTQGSGARPIAPPKVAPAYDPQFRSDIPSDWRLPANSNRCTYPFAMPLVVETVKGAALKSRTSRPVTSTTVGHFPL